MNNWRFLLLLFYVVVSLSACGGGFYEPPNNVDFSRIEKLSELDGVYRNLGEGAEGRKAVFLSALIWSKAEGIEHSSISSVEVKAIKKDTVLIKAYGKEGIVKEDTFVEGKDFNIKSGRVYLKQYFRIPTGAGVPFLGVDYESVEIGLDRRGSGKYSTTSGAAGLIYLVVPFAVHIRDEVRFVRVQE
jgi:hypothetical protein